jgi:hypothetical protein
MVTPLPLSPSSQSQKSFAPAVDSSIIHTENPNQVEKSVKTYQVAQQVEYLHLQAEIDVLLQKLQALSKEPQKSDYATAKSDH